MNNITITNIVVLLLATLFLIYVLNNQKSNRNKSNQILTIFQKISQNQELRQSQKDILTEKYSIYNINYQPIQCFLYAFTKIVIHSSYQSQKLFTIFETNNQQYANFNQCSHFYQLLLYRSASIVSNDKDQVRNTIFNLIKQHDILEEQQSLICVVYYLQNDQRNIRNKLNTLFQQQYENFTIHIINDVSADNTLIITKYIADQLQREKANIDLKIHKNQKFQGVYKSLNKTRQFCPQKSIVVFLDKYDTLVQHLALKMINKQFINQKNKFVIFNSLIANRTNLAFSNNTNKQQILKNIVNPILAFRNKQLKIQSEITSTQQQLYRSIITHNLFKNTNLTLSSKILTTRIQNKIDDLTNKLLNIWDNQSL